MPELSPYDTGERCEATPWIPYGTKVSEATPAEDFGKVNFDNDEDGTECTIHVERAEDGRHVVVIDNHGDDEDITVSLRLEKTIVSVDRSGVRTFVNAPAD